MNVAIPDFHILLFKEKRQPCNLQMSLHIFANDEDLPFRTVAPRIVSFTFLILYLY